MTYTIAVCTTKTPDDGQRNCPKHVEFHSKNKFDKFSASGWFYYKNLLFYILIFLFYVFYNLTDFLTLVNRN